VLTSDTTLAPSFVPNTRYEASAALRAPSTVTAASFARTTAATFACSSAATAVPCWWPGDGLSTAWHFTPEPACT
jgi:hypothetical protein